MTAGIQIFNADGSLQFDTTNRLYRVLTRLDTGATNGSTTVSPGGTVAVVAQPRDINKVQPDVSVSGGSVSWTYGAGTKDNNRLLIMEY